MSGIPPSSPDAPAPAEREQLRAVLRLLPVGVFLTDVSGRLLEANPAALAIWGMVPPQVAGISEYRLFEGYWPDSGRRLEPSEWGVARALEHRELVLNQELDIVAFDGARRTILTSAAPLYDAHGTLMGAVSVNVDITERKVSERAEAFLSEASSLLAGSLEWETTLRAVARLATREWADFCLVDMLGEDGALHRLAVAARDPAQQELLERLRAFAPRLDADTPLTRALAQGRPLLQENVDDAWKDALARSPEHRRLMDEMGARSVLVLPLTAAGRRFGIISLHSRSPARRYSGRDMAYAEEFARRAALALENARLYREAQRALRERDRTLALLGAFLSAAPVGMAFLDRELRYVHINPVLAATNGVPVEAHLGHTVREVLRARAEPAESLVRKVLETGEPVVEWPLEDPRGPEPRHFIASYYPVDSGGERLGVGATVTEVTEQKREEGRLRFLAEATARLSGSLDWRTTLGTVAQLLVERLSDFCVVDVLIPDGEKLERVEARAREASVQELLRQSMRFPPPPGARTPLRRVLETGRAELIAEVDPAMLDALAVSPEHRRLLEALGLRSLMVVPLVARGRTLGVVSVVSRQQGRRYTPRDLAFLEDVASRAALAVDNAWLYRQAEGAVAARDEFVAIATHELRTPLSALQLQLASLQRALDRGQPLPPERLHQGLASARRQADRLNHLISHLFDVARISAGRLELEREEVDLTALAHRLLGRMEDVLVTAGCEPVVHAGGPVVARVDKLRVEQVLMNLLSNAMKYAPGQPVELSVEQEDGHAVIAVRDWGPGIPRDAQGRVFERFERASGTHAQASLGLGLYISRQIARAHGGELSVEEPPSGPGARFVLRLPLG
jgi:PAS domain S-box-containing protein